ncbi:MAG: hypothetical protein WAX04_03305 [Oscillospiraceae bacterium]
MSYIELSKTNNENIKILIFAEGTVLKPKSLFSLYNHNAYLPIGNCVNLINEWSKQGAEIVYCTSCKGKKALEMADILRRYGFAGTKIYYRNKGEKYKDVIETVKPTILIEDDCRSIGGSWQMCITNVGSQLKKLIKSIVVKEFKGIDNLSQNISELQ